MTDQPGYVAPSGWYVDPTTSLHLRWWSGLAWTEHVAPIPEIVSDPDSYPTATEANRTEAEDRLAEARHAPPPVPRLAPVSSYGWEREAGTSESAPA
jgi:hypothetical protein